MSIPPTPAPKPAPKPLQAQVSATPPLDSQRWQDQIPPPAVVQAAPLPSDSYTQADSSPATTATPARNSARLQSKEGFKTDKRKSLATPAPAPTPTATTTPSPGKASQPTPASPPASSGGVKLDPAQLDDALLKLAAAAGTLGVAVAGAAAGAVSALGSLGLVGAGTVKAVSDGLGSLLPDRPESSEPPAPPATPGTEQRRPRAPASTPTTVPSTTTPTQRPSQTSTPTQTFPATATATPTPATTPTASSTPAVTDNQKPQHVNADPRNPIEIKKTGWTPQRYQEWFSNLPTMQTPRNKPQDLFEIEHTGPLNYRISGGSESFWADGIQQQNVLETKMVVTPKKSPFIEGAGANTPPFIRENMLDEVREEFRRLSIILRDQGNPLESLRVITNNKDAKPFFEALMREHRIPGEVVVR